MANESLTPSRVTVNKALLSSYDGTKTETIAPLITEINISQSIDNTAFRGSIKIRDSVGLLEKFPLRAEERLILEIQSNDLITKKRLDLQIFKIDNVSVTDTNDGVSYYIHFVSKITFESSRRKIIRSFNNKSVNQIVRVLFNDYFNRIEKTNDLLPLGGQKYNIKDSNERSLIIQPTENLFSCVVPNYTPSEAMYFLATRAYINTIDSLSSCTYRFFETLDEYFFVSDEYLIKKAIENDEVVQLVYSPIVSKDSRDIKQQILSVEVLENQKRADTSSDLYSGGYTNKILELDLIRGEARNIHFDYLQDGNRFTETSGNQNDERSRVHTDRFTRDTFTRENAKPHIIFRDYADEGDISGTLKGEQYLAEITSRRIAYHHHLNNTVVSVSLSGRLDFKPGQIVNIEIFELNSADKKSRNPQLSGNYLVHTTNHNIQGDELNTSMKLIKYDWST